MLQVFSLLAHAVVAGAEHVARDGRRYAFADHNCFACGAGNPIGMGLHIELGEGTARASWTVGNDFVGWSDRVHGGIIATLLDEVMAWARRPMGQGSRAAPGIPRVSAFPRTWRASRDPRRGLKQLKQSPAARGRLAGRRRLR